MKKSNFLTTASALILATSLSLSATTYATVNGEAVTDDDIKAINPKLNINNLNADQKKLLINKLIDNKLISKYASKQSVVKSSTFKKTIDKIKSDLALKMFMEEEFADIKVSEKEALELFNKEYDRISKNKQVHARHILVETEEEAKNIIKKLKNSKNIQEDFIAEAKVSSTGPSGKNGGDLGWFTKEKMVPEFAEAAFKLKKGEITTTPVKTQFGYHIILSEGSSDDFNDIKDGLIKDLKVKKFQEKIDNLAKRLRKKSSIKLIK